jgi:hypothetical protein
VNLQNLKDVLTFAAFQPEQDDPTSPWKKRFAGRRSLLLNVGKNKIQWMALSKTGKFGAVGEVEGELKEMVMGSADEWKKLTDGGWCGVSLNNRYVISLETNLSRKKGCEELLKTSPRQVLGAKYERGKRYALTHNPESNSSLLLTCEDDTIKKIEALLKEAGFQAGRICVGTYAMLRHLIAVAEKNKPKSANQVSPEEEGGEAAADKEKLYLVCNFGAVAILSRKGNQWSDLRSRTDVFNEDPGPLLELLAPFKQQMNPPFDVHLLCHDILPPLATAVESFFTGANFTDHTKPGAIWAMMRDY